MAVGKNITCKKGNGEQYHLSLYIEAIWKIIKWEISREEKPLNNGLDT